MTRKVATVTLNPAIDLVGLASQIELGEVNSLQTLGLYPAGKGNNVANVLSCFKQPTLVTGLYGADNCAEFDQLFKRLGVENAYYKVAGKTRINCKVTEKNGEVTDLNFSGFEVSPQDWQNFKAHSLKVLAGYDYVAVCGSLPKGVDAVAFKQWLEELKGIGCKVILDTSNKALEEGLKAGPFLIKPNEKELSVLVGRKLSTVEEISRAANELQKEYDIKNVVVSMGSQGSLWICHSEKLLARPPRVENIVSTVGAGDSMVAGLIYGFANDFRNEDTLTLATAVSAYAVTQSNVGFKELSELDNFKEQVAVSSLMFAIFD